MYLDNRSLSNFQLIKQPRRRRRQRLCARAGLLHDREKTSLNALDQDDPTEPSDLNSRKSRRLNSPGVPRTVMLAFLLSPRDTSVPSHLLYVDRERVDSPTCLPTRKATVRGHVRRGAPKDRGEADT